LLSHEQGASLPAASAGPMTQTADRIERLAEAGVGAVVLPSLFEEQIRAEADRDERLAEVGIDSFGEATSYLIDPDASRWPRQYLDLVQRAAKPGIPDWSCSTASCRPTSTLRPSLSAPVSSCQARPRPPCPGPGSPGCAARCAPRSPRAPAWKPLTMSPPTYWQARTR
jgi:hypothetical protein